MVTCEYVHFMSELPATTNLIEEIGDVNLFSTGQEIASVKLHTHNLKWTPFTTIHFQSVKVQGSGASTIKPHILLLGHGQIIDKSSAVNEAKYKPS